MRQNNNKSENGHNGSQPTMSIEEFLEFHRNYKLSMIEKKNMSKTSVIYHNYDNYSVAYQ